MARAVFAWAAVPSIGLPVPAAAARILNVAGAITASLALLIDPAATGGLTAGVVAETHAVQAVLRFSTGLARTS